MVRTRINKKGLTEKARWRREGRWGGGGIKHLSNASLMARHRGFRAPSLLFLPWVLGTTGKLSTHTSLFAHLPILSYTYPPHSIIPPSYAHFSICIIQHVMLLCHFVFLFLPILPFFGAYLLFPFQVWWSGRKGGCFVTSCPNKCL